MTCRNSRITAHGTAWLAGCLLALVLPGLTWSAEDILKPAEAFRYEVTTAEQDVIVRWRIEPGHYLYKERMSYVSRTDGVQLGEAVLPPGKPYHDEFFGDMHIYRGAAEVRIPIVHRALGADALQLELRSQGCADIGLCYPPQVWTASVPLEESGGGSVLQRLLLDRSAAQQTGDPLPAEKAFRPAVEIIDPFNLRVHWLIADGYYLYRDSLTVSASGDVAQTATPVIPPGTPKWD